MPNKIKYVIYFLRSKRDINGNVYFAFEMWNTETGQNLNGTCDNHDTPEIGIRHRAKWDGEVLRFERELSKRLFKTRTRNYKYYLINEIVIASNNKEI